MSENRTAVTYIRTRVGTALARLDPAGPGRPRTLAGRRSGAEHPDRLPGVLRPRPRAARLEPAEPHRAGRRRRHYTTGNGMNSVVSAVASSRRPAHLLRPLGGRARGEHPRPGPGHDLDPRRRQRGERRRLPVDDERLRRRHDHAGDGDHARLEPGPDPARPDGCAFAGTANQIRCSVPVNPRCTAGGCVATLNQSIRFDGGDRIVTSGGPISFVHNQDPKCIAGCATDNMTIIGGATEVLSKQAFQNATSYSIPIGENLWTGERHRDRAVPVRRPRPPGVRGQHRRRRSTAPAAARSR